MSSTQRRTIRVAHLRPGETHLEEHEGRPLELLGALGGLDEAGEAGLPDLQDEERGGYTLWEETHTHMRQEDRRAPGGGVDEL